MSLNTAVIYGSARSARQGIKAARFIENQLITRGHDVSIVDSEEFNLPMLDRMFKEYDTDTVPAPMAAVANTLSAADGFVIVSAEYNHSIPAALKNLLDHYQKEYLYKPSAIVTYSAGPFGGVRALVNLRAILAELGTPSIPSAFPVSRFTKHLMTKAMPLTTRTRSGSSSFWMSMSGTPGPYGKLETMTGAMRRRRHSRLCVAVKNPENNKSTW